MDLNDKGMKTFEAQKELNENRVFNSQSIEYQFESFDFEIFESRELVYVSLDEMVFECLVSSIEIPFGHGFTSVTFTPINRFK